MADTDISLSVGLEVKDAEKTAQELQKEIKDIFESKNDEQSASMVNLEIQMKKTYDSAETLRQKMAELMEGGPLIPTEQFQKIDQEFDEVNTRLEQAWREFLELGQKEYNSKTYSSKTVQLNKEIDELTVKFNELEDARKKLMDEGQDTIAVESTEEYKKLQTQLDATNDKLKQQIIHYREIERSQQASLDKTMAKQAMSAETAAAQAANAALKQQQQEMADLSKSLMGVTSSVRGLSRLIPGVSASGIYGIRMLTMGITRLTNLTKKDLVNAVKALTGAVKKLLTLIFTNPILLLVAALVAALVIMIKKIKEARENIKKFVDALGQGLKDGIKNLGKLGVKLFKSLTEQFFKLGLVLPKLFTRAVKILINKLNSLRSIITSMLDEIAAWNYGMNEVNNALSNITSSISYLKAAITTVFVPILTLIEPIITRITDKLAEIVTQVGILIAKLTGANTFIKATRIQKDYAESLKESSENLASFDKLNVINQDNGKTVDFKLVDLEDTQIPKWFNNLERLGRKVAVTITNFLGKIPWKNIQTNAKKAGKTIAQFFNSFNGVEGIGDSIGRTFGNALNTIIEFVSSFIKQLDGRKLGWQIGSALETMIKTIDFKELGSMFSGALNNLMDIITGITDQFSGTELANALTEFLSTGLGDIDWQKVNAAIQGVITDFVEFLNAALTPQNLSLVGQTLQNTLTSLFTSIKLFGDTAQWKQWGESIGVAINNFFADDEMWEMGAEAINSFCLGLEDMIIAAIEKVNWVDGPDSVSQRIIDFLSNINWKDIGAKALEISKKLREGLWKIWEELKNSGAFEDILQVIVDFLNEKEEWEKMISKVKKEMVNRVFVENFWHIINPLNWFDWEPLMTKLKEIKNFFFEDEGTPGNTHGAGSSFGSPSKSSTSTHIRGYATGAVIPPSMSAHLAVLGDNNTETEVVSPLSTMEQALRNVLAEQNINVTFQVEGDSNNIFRVVQKEAKSYNKRTGSYAFGG